MEYVQITDEQRKRMLAAIGARDVEELLADIPADVRLGRPLDLPAALSEQAVRRELLARAEQTGGPYVCFAGAGAYDHYIPAVVDSLAAQGAVLTAYTPYQAEASQGSLQAFFEFQTLICQLTGMDVANASMYEGATALAEAALMLADDNGRRHVVVAGALHPHYLAVLKTYLADLPLTLTVVPPVAGAADAEAVRQALTPDTAAVIVQSPNFFGVIEPALAEIAAAAHAGGAGVIQVFDPISLAVLKRPAEWGVDVAVGEGQPLGTPLSFGGPYLGLFACRQKYVRKMPGRLIGRTTDADGRPAYCLTLQTREQHIRRAKATSNICTNQGLIAYRAAVHLAAMGPAGLARAATTSMQQAHKLAARIAALDGYELPFGAQPMFREFVVRCTRAKVDDVIDAAVARGIIPGVALKWFYDDLADCLLIACTEKRSDAELDALVDVLAAAAKR